MVGSFDVMQFLSIITLLLGESRMQYNNYNSIITIGIPMIGYNT